MGVWRWDVVGMRLFYRRMLVGLYRSTPDLVSAQHKQHVGSHSNCVLLVRHSLNTTNSSKLVTYILMRSD